MKSLGQLLNNVVVKKSYGYKYHTFRTNTQRKFKFNSKMIDKVDICIATNLLNNMIIKTEEDYVLALNALSVLGAGAKQLKSRGELEKDTMYAFRRYHFYKIMASAINSGIDIKFSTGIDENTNQPVSYVSIASLQFSFHINSESIVSFCKENNIDIVNEQEWNKSFSMQNGAKELFEYCLYLKNTSNTLSQERPKEFVDFLRQSYYLSEENIENDFNMSMSKFTEKQFLEKLTYEYEKGIINGK